MIEGVKLLFGVFLISVIPFSFLLMFMALGETSVEIQRKEHQEFMQECLLYEKNYECISKWRKTNG